MTIPLTNGGFDSNLTGWNQSGSPSVYEWVDGQAHLVAGVGVGRIFQNVPAHAPGTTFRITYRITDAGVNNFRSSLFMGGTSYGAQHANPGIYSDILVSPTGEAGSVGIEALSGGEIYIDWIVLETEMAGFFTTQMQDRDDDMRQFTLPTTQVTSANHDAQYALAQALVAGVEGISRLTTKQWDFGARRTETGDPKPTAGSAQVNIEWQVTYIEDTTLEVRTVRIGGANLDISGILLAGSNVADLSATEMAAFVTAFEAYVVGPNGNAVTVSQVAFLE